MSTPTKSFIRKFHLTRKYCYRNIVRVCDFNHMMMSNHTVRAFKKKLPPSDMWQAVALKIVRSSRRGCAAAYTFEPHGCGVARECDYKLTMEGKYTPKTDPS
eukprot:6179302-Amphidinium_carterae.1